MAKKGKGKKGKKGDEVGKDGALGEDEAARAKLLLLINSEQKRSAAFEKEVRSLREENMELKAKLKKQDADHADIHEYLTKSLDQNFKNAEALRVELETLQKSSKQVENRLQSELSESREKHATDVRSLEKDVMEKSIKLHELDVFAREKENIEDLITELREDLQKERAARVRDCRELERRNVREKERLKKEMLIKIKETKQNLLSRTEEQLDATTKRTIMENEHIVTELHYQSKESDRVSKSNDAMRKEITRLKRDCELASSKAAEVTKRMRKYERLAKSLQEELAAAQSFQPNEEATYPVDMEDNGKGNGAAHSSAEQKYGVIVDKLRTRIEELEEALREVCLEIASSRRRGKGKSGKKRGRKFGSAPPEGSLEHKRAAQYLCSLLNELRARTSAEELPMVLSSRFAELLKMIERRMCAHPTLRIEIEAARSMGTSRHMSSTSTIPPSSPIKSRVSLRGTDLQTNSTTSLPRIGVAAVNYSTYEPVEVDAVFTSPPAAWKSPGAFRSSAPHNNGRRIRDVSGGADPAMGLGDVRSWGAPAKSRS